MLVVSYLIFDAYFLFLNLFLSLASLFIVVLSFKEQLLFLYCLPYLSQVGISNFLVTTFSGVLYLYPYLLLSVLGLILPFIVFIGFSFLFFPILSNVSVRYYFFLSTVFLTFFVCYLYFFIACFVPLVVWSLIIFVPNFYRVISVSFDFTLDAWILVLLSSFFFTLVFFLICVASLFCLTMIKQRHTFPFRVVAYLVFLLFVVVFVPYDALLHLVLNTVFVICVEFFVIFRCLFSSYYGRVA